MKIESLVRKNILTLKPYSSARDEFKGTDSVFLDANESPYGDLNRYPDPYQSQLKLKLANFKNVNAKHIFIGNGSDEIIDLLFRIFCEPKIDKALTFTPTFGMYEVASAINDVELVKIPLNSNFQISSKVIDDIKQIENLKLIFICSPNNPTGNLMNFEVVESIVKQFEGLIVIDEAYIDFAQAKSFISMLENYSNLVVLQTFSKAWSAASVRIGVAYTNSDIIQFLNNVKMPYNVSLLNQNAALNTLNNSQLFQENLDLILTEKNKLYNALKTFSFVEKVYPSDANFFLVKMINAQKIYDDLVRKNVITRNRSSLVESCLRITVGTAKENIKLLEALNTIDK